MNCTSWISLWFINTALASFTLVPGPHLSHLLLWLIAQPWPEDSTWVNRYVSGVSSMFHLLWTIGDMAYGPEKHPTFLSLQNVPPHQRAWPSLRNLMLHSKTTNRHWPHIMASLLGFPLLDLISLPTPPPFFTNLASHTHSIYTFTILQLLVINFPDRQIRMAFNIPTCVPVLGNVGDTDMLYISIPENSSQKAIKYSRFLL